MGYIDDSILLADSPQELIASVQAKITLLDSLGFTINGKKSVFTPTKKCEFLGFVIDPTQMTVSLTSY